MKAKSPSRVPDDSYGAFAYFVSQCASGLCKELVEKGKTEIQARNAVIHCFLDMASGEACRVARGEGRDPDQNKWRDAADKAFARAVKRTNSNPSVSEPPASYRRIYDEMQRDKVPADERAKS